MIQRLRLCSGLVLFTYVSTHLLNHSLGTISLAAAEAGRFWFIGFWRHPIATTLLYGSLLTHLTLVLLALYRRRHLRIPAWEILRLSLGLLIPLLLINHLFGTRVTHELAGVDDSYRRMVTIFWVLNPTSGLIQVLLLCVAWTHGCLGLYFWLRVKRWRRITLPTLRLLGVIVPLLALLGFVNLGLEVSALADDPAWLGQAVVPVGPETDATVDLLRELTRSLFLGSVFGVFLARWVRTVVQRRQGVIRLTYPAGRRVSITPGTSVLEASRAAGIPHASLCGGRGRCSTCRTRIRPVADGAPGPSADEARVLKRIGAPPNVRLACQLRPNADLEVFPLLPPIGGLPTDPLRPGQAGAEREIAILFADLRSFTRFAENRLPYDVVFVLNQYFSTMGAAIEQAGGRLDKFIGDGIMALFGLNAEASQGCRQALVATQAMANALEGLNHTLRHELKEPLRIGIGLHVGQVIVGEMGHGRVRSLTAIGDAVNTASRLEALNKEYGSQLIVSDDLARRANVDLSAFPQQEIEVRGRANPLCIWIVDDARRLEPLLQGATVAAT